MDDIELMFGKQLVSASMSGVLLVLGVEESHQGRMKPDPTVDRDAGTHALDARAEV